MGDHGENTIMRILFITNNLPPLVDGVGDYTYNLACEFAKHGHETHIICRNKQEIHDDYENIHVAKIVEKWNRQAGRQIADYIRKNGIEVVSLQYVPYAYHSKGLPFGLIPAVYEIKKTGAKLMVFCHEVSVEFFHASLKKHFYEKLMRYVSKRILQKADGMATSVVHYRKMMEDLDFSNVGVIPIASNIPEYQYSKQKIDDLKQQVAPAGEIIVSFFGKRDSITSMKAIQELQNEGIGIKTLLIGKVTIPSEYRQENCYETGVLDMTELYKYFLVSDIMVLPEGNSYGCSFKSGSFAACLRAGLAVCTGKGYLTDESLKHNENVVFADFCSVDDIKEKLRTLLLNKDMRDRIGEEAKKLVTDRTWDRTYQGYLKIITNG